MTERAGLHGTEVDGIFFTESFAPPGVRIVRKISVSRNRQNSNLNEIKRMMAKEARSAGANSITGFKYGQRSHKWWQLVFTFKWDSETWYGEGDAVQL